MGYDGKDMAYFLSQPRNTDAALPWAHNALACARSGHQVRPNLWLRLAMALAFVLWRVELLEVCDSRIPASPRLASEAHVHVYDMSIDLSQARPAMRMTRPS